MIETYLIRSVLELKYRQTRITVADEMMEEQASQFLKAPAETRYLVAPERAPRRSRRRRSMRRRWTAFTGLTPQAGRLGAAT